MELNNKEILLNNDSLIRDIQYEFSASYPFLKIEFLVKSNAGKRGRSILLDPNILLRKLVDIQPRKIDINCNRTVSEVSNDLQDILGVTVQLSRKSGNVWSAISISDSWTLQSQNVAGEFITSQMAIDAGAP